MRSVADGAGNLSDSHLRGGGAKALDVALIFGKPVGDFQAERNRLGVNAMGAPDLRSVAILMRTQVEHFAEQNKARSMMQEASRICSACAVSTMSFEVRPCEANGPQRGRRWFRRRSW